MWPWAIGELPKILGFPFNIDTMVEANDFKFGTQLGFAKAHHKICLLYTSDAADEEDSVDILSVSCFMCRFSCFFAT